MLDSESREQRQIESLEAIEERLEYLIEVLLWIGEFAEARGGYRPMGKGSPRRPDPPPWSKDAEGQ